MRDALLYAAAGAAYVALGVFVPVFLFTWPVGAAFLLLAVWVAPALVRRIW